MKEFARNLLPAAILAGFCCGAALAADLSTVGQWTNKYPRAGRILIESGFPKDRKSDSTC
jgi:hypothetical protein